MNEELKIIISAEIDKLKKELQQGQKELKNFEKQGESFGSKFSRAMSTAGKTVGTAFKAIGTAAVAGMAAIVGLTESMADYSAAQAKLKTAFETAGSSAEQATTTYNDLYRVLGDGDVAVEAAGHLAKLTTDQKELSEWTTVCQGVYATFGDSLPIESLTEAANETAKTGEITGALADALNWAGVNEDEFADKLFWCNTEAEREALIRSTLTDLYGDAAGAYEENAKQLLDANEAQANLTNSLAALSGILTPLVTVLKNGLATTLQELTPHLGLVAQGVQDMVNGVDGGAEKVSEGVSSILVSLITKISSALPSIVSVGMELIGSLIQGIVDAAPDLINGILSVSEVILTALPGLIKDTLSALISLLPMLISGIIDLIVMVCDNIDSIVDPIIEAIPLVVISIVDGLMSNLDKLIGGLIRLVLGIVNNIPKILQSIISALPTVISLIVSGILSNLPLLIAGLLQVALGVAKAVPSILASVVLATVSVFVGIWDGIGKVFAGVGAWFAKVFKGAADAIKKAFSSITGFFSGIWNSIKSTFSKVGSTIGNAITNTVKTAVNGVLSTATKIINGFINAINAAIGVINAIPGVNIKKLSTLSVPKMARGGIVDAATLAMIGENGKEAVVPLENNTEWLDMLTERLVAAIGGGGQPIYLQIDGKTFGQITADSLNALTKQRGSLPLVIM